MIQKDYIMRAVEQAMQAILRGMGLVEENRLEEADGETESVYGALGLDRRTVELLDAASLATMVPDRAHLRVLARTLQLEGRILAAAESHGAARRRHDKAAVLLEASGPCAEGDTSLFTELDERIDSMTDWRESQ